MIEKLFELISPDTCVNCGLEGNCVCESCKNIVLVIKKPSCVFCNKLNDNGKTCSNCYAKTKLRGASINYRYEGEVKELIRSMKYENKRSIARYFGGQLPKTDGIVCFVPSDGSARRRRGYDQAEIIARAYSKKFGLKFEPLLIRKKHIRQVGKGRSERIKNIKDSFVATKALTGLNVVLVDDVITTGSTVRECAIILKQAGAKSVWALAVAKG